MAKIKPRSILIVVASSIICVSVLLFIRHERALAPENEAPNNQLAATQTAQKPERYSYPERLQIKAIGVDAKVQYVGMTSQDELATPSNITDVGWYKLGTRPGNPGSAVIDGHFNGPKGQAGVFNKLDELKRGDKITTTDAKGKIATFIVTGLRTYEASEQPKEVFDYNGNAAYLNLITCSGSWNAEQREYSTRTVVFTRKIDK